jgi:hypothetical protein
MNRAHAFWSFGFFAAGIISALIAQSGLLPQVHLFLMVPLVVVGVALILGRFDPAPHRRRYAPALRAGPCRASINHHLSTLNSSTKARWHWAPGRRP